MPKLDVKDLKILAELSRNCRIPVTQLAKKVQLSREVVNYRIKRLIEKGFIVDFITEIDESKLDFERYVIYFVFQNLDENKEKEIIDYIVNHPFISWTTTSTGKWSIIFDFVAKDVYQINDFINDIKEKFSAYIGEYVIASQIQYKHFHSKYYETKQEQITKKQKHIPHKIDKLDLKLLNILSNNARLDYVELSRQLNLSPNGVKNRVKALIHVGIIKSFYIHPNKTLLGYVQYYIQLDFVNQTKQQEKEIISYIENHPNMNAYYKPLGHWSIEVAVFVRNPEELRKIIFDLRNKFGKIIKVHDTMLFYEEPKSNYLPEGVFDISLYS